MTGFPLLLDVAGRRVVVVGGGPVAARRARSLLAAGATVVVVAPDVGPELDGLDVAIERRPFAPADLDAAWLAVACTDRSDVNTAVGVAAEERHIFCVRADLAAAGTARVPAVTRREGVTVAVSGGDDPRRAALLRDAIAAALDAGDLPARRHRRVPVASVTPAAPGGRVVLVGGGPGDPDLITVRGRRLVADADVVVVDRLAPRALLADLSEDVEIVDCGKSPHRHNLTQAQINEVLVDRARRGKLVVRLKGGDPFVFGRGGEEWLACVAAGVPVEVVPGLSSALAGPALAGIPVTHRKVAADFTVVSGHLDPGRPPESGVDWPGLATHAGTLVILMAMDRLRLITDDLVRHGRPADTPAAVVHRATLPEQRVVRASLATLADEVERAGIGAPAVVVVGDVVAVLDPS
ncbi:uroporphyrinogen-III C-methyltransferase [Jatrophihabitans endophyticus]|uniref:uroporphyrinogen-III C-methyltransferase n=1 Tax=Jatrophihabitans endophyticus TaxID=1206085 RepID=UPI000932CEE6|nr:uroporphyrinogen-III C-methyltransferase [Jatrophihabitans endophyticus]